MLTIQKSTSRAPQRSMETQQAFMEVRKNDPVERLFGRLYILRDFIVNQVLAADRPLYGRFRLTCQRFKVSVYIPTISLFYRSAL